MKLITKIFALIFVIIISIISASLTFIYHFSVYEENSKLQDQYDILQEAVATKNISLCKQYYTTAKSCMREVAFMVKDESLCDQIPYGSYIEKQHINACKAAVNKDVSICEDIDEFDLHMSCKFSQDKDKCKLDNKASFSKVCRLFYKQTIG